MADGRADVFANRISRYRRPAGKGGRVYASAPGASAVSPSSAAGFKGASSAATSASPATAASGVSPGAPPGAGGAPPTQASMVSPTWGPNPSMGGANQPYPAAGVDTSGGGVLGPDGQMVPASQLGQMSGGFSVQTGLGGQPGATVNGVAGGTVVGPTYTPNAFEQSMADAAVQGPEAVNALLASTGYGYSVNGVPGGMVIGATPTPTAAWITPSGGVVNSNTNPGGGAVQVPQQLANWMASNPPPYTQEEQNMAYAVYGMVI